MPRRCTATVFFLDYVLDAVFTIAGDAGNLFAVIFEHVFRSLPENPGWAARGAGNRLADKRNIWVCAYANNQHDLGSEIPADPKETPFYKAMQLCDGVVVVLDGKATPFTRVWCCFEFAMVVLGKKLLLDFATVHDGEPQVLTEGFASEDEK